MLSMDKFCTDIWMHVAILTHSLEDFVRLWLSVPVIFRNRDIHSREFWLNLVDAVCYHRNMNATFIRERIEQYSTGVEIVRKLFTSRHCTRSGCYQRYREWDNVPYACHYHSGTLRPGGLLSCCRGKGFRSPGCKQFHHECGVLLFVNMVRGEDIDTSPANKGINGLTLPPISNGRVASNKTPNIETAGNRARSDQVLAPALLLPELYCN